MLSPTYFGPHGANIKETKCKTTCQFTSPSALGSAAQCGSLCIKTFYFLVTLRPDAGHGLLIRDVSRSHITTHHNR